MFKTVLFPIAFGEKAVTVKQAVKFMQGFGTERFDLLHVFESGFARVGTVRRWLERLETTLRSDRDADITVLCRTGQPALEIIRAARENAADYIYIPSRQKGLLQTTLLGSTAQDVIRLTDLPTFVHKQRPDLQRRRADKRAPRVMLYATDFGESAARALPYVRALCSDHCSLHILHVGRRGGDPRAEKRRQERVLERLETIRREVEPDIPAVEVRALVGIAHREILRTADASRAELVVLGRFGTAPMDLFLGSTAELVVNKARQSILLVP
ncbi:MAG: universal stress protein [Methanomicrobiaceae archaeon]|nr:universal stress protein [Methanomicrobiaceae archaeon]